MMNMHTPTIRAVLRPLVAAAVLSALPLALRAQRADTLRSVLRFRVNESVVDTLRADNAAAIACLRRQFSVLCAGESQKIQKMVVTSWASPEGRSAYNADLARRRAESTAALLAALFPSLEGRIAARAAAEDWEGLRRSIAADGRFSDAERRAVADILDSPAADAVKKARLRRLACYRRLLASSFYTGLRRSDIVAVVTIPGPAPVISENDTADTAAVVQPATDSLEFVPVVPDDSIKTGRRTWVMGAGSNLLYDALLVPNVMVDIPLSRRYSLTAHWMYAWWKTDRRHYYWRTYGGDVELRRWWPRKDSDRPLTGHHLGLYGQIVTFDFETGGRGYLGDRWTAGGGISYGYSLPVGRRLNLDFSLALGYLGGGYKEYLPMDGCYVWQRTRRLRYVGPTRAEVSLVWLIPFHHTVRKGGAR